MTGKEREKFDDHWRQRLADYPQSSDYQVNRQLLKSEIDQSLPFKKPKRKILFLFCGIPGAGKSTLAKFIKQIHPSVVLSSCWIFFDRLKSRLENDYYQAYVYQEDLAQDYLGQGYSVIMDDNNRTVKNRTTVYRWAQKLEAQPILINIEI